MIVMPLTRKLYCLVGLIMGTRMWYSFWDAEKDDNAAFERRVDQVLREVGERGRPIVAESVPPQARVKRPLGPSATAAAQSSPPAPTPASAVAAAPTPALSLALPPARVLAGGDGGDGGTTGETSACWGWC